MTLRARFSRTSGPYFLSHSVGLLPVSADAALEQAFLGPWRRGDGAAWTHWMKALDDFRDDIGALIGAQAADICPQTNISSALTKILHSLPADDRRRRIVLSDDDFPTVGFVMAQAARMGLSVEFLKGGAHLADPDAWAPAMADDVRLVHITHVFSNSALCTPVAEITRRARAAGVFSIVDAAQSAGAVRVRADAWAADFIVGTCVKYLCGGPGAAWLWAAPETAAVCRPIDVGWFSHARPFAFDIHEFTYADGALRFLGGTPSIAPLAIARAGVRTLLEIGPEAVFAHNASLIDRFIGSLPAYALRSHVRSGERGVSALVQPRRLDAARQALKEAGIAHDERLGAIRASMHIYTSQADVDAFVAAIAPAL